jgi:hypothetical protein
MQKPPGWADFALDITTWTRNGAVYREKSLDFSSYGHRARLLRMLEL